MVAIDVMHSVPDVHVSTDDDVANGWDGYWLVEIDSDWGGCFETPEVAVALDCLAYSDLDFLVARSMLVPQNKLK